MPQPTRRLQTRAHTPLAMAIVLSAGMLLGWSASPVQAQPRSGDQARAQPAGETAGAAGCGSRRSRLQELVRADDRGCGATARQWRRRPRSDDIAMAPPRRHCPATPAFRRDCAVGS